MMIEMLPKLHIPMPSRRDVEIPLHLIARQASEDATAPAPAAWRPAEFPLRATHLAQDVARVGIAFELLLLRDGQMIEHMNPLGVHPLIPVGGIFAQQVAGQDSIAAGVLHVDVEIGAAHGHHDVEIDLQLMRHPFLHREEVRLVSAVPAPELRPGEDGRCHEEEERRVAPRRAAAGVGWFGFGCPRTRTRTRKGLAGVGREEMGGDA